LGFLFASVAKLGFVLGLQLLVDLLTQGFLVHRWGIIASGHECYSFPVPAIEIINPATGERVGSVERTPIESIPGLVQQARKAQRAWGSLRFADRARVIRRLHDLVIDRAEKILDTIQSETGKSRRDALAEVVTVAGTARYYLTHGEGYLAAKRKRGAIPLLTHSTLEHRPHGVVGLIVPWNYPFLLSVGDALPALLAGNAVLLKPSDLTPFTALLGKALLEESGLDPDLMTIVQGGPDVGGELIRQVSYVGFTGSSANGRKVAVAAAERLIPFSLELGGKNPMIVLKDAPLEEAAEALLAGAFSNAGQTCISVERIYVESPVFDRFAQLVADRTRAIKLGWSRSFDMDIGSMIHASHAARVQQAIDAAIEQGASVLAGAKRRPDLGSAFVEPTVLTQVDRKAPIAVEETFGPVVSLHRVESRDEAIALANDSQYGLNASVWAGGAAPAMAIARQLEAGSVAINSTLMIYSAFDLPMGGVKQSGIGRRHAEQGILRYTQAQSIVRSFQSGGGYDATLKWINSEKMAAAMLKIVKFWRRIPGFR
jgi:succinate-semialdehyde dehydrogenase/glutarate-semialdehyde dehydrogenase